MKPLIALIALMAVTVLGMMSMLSPAAADGYKIKPGDILTLEVLEDPSLNRTLLVAPDGRISLPQAGTLAVSGQTVDAIGGAIAAKIAPNFATPPTVSIALQQLAVATATGGTATGTMDVYVIGEANKAGRLALPRRSTVLQTFAEMGGFTKFAATKRIQLRRTDAKTGASVTFNLNYDAIMAGTTADGGITLKPGDVILVPQRHLFE